MSALGYEESARSLVWDGTDYIATTHTAYLGDGADMVFFHLDVFYMSHNVLKDMKAQWKIFRESFIGPLFCMFTEERDAHRRLAAHIGFKPLSLVQCTDGKTRTIYVSLGPT